jgi:hypothetical protein
MVVLASSLRDTAASGEFKAHGCELIPYWLVEWRFVTGLS